MKYGIISGNPKRAGLCHAMTEAVFQGARAGGADPEIMTVEKLDRCHVCGDGWGICREKHYCTFGADGFDLARETINAAEQLCFITPVYWGEMAEALKSFFDRLRRCDFGQEGVLGGKQILLVASAGGTGNGLLTCLEQMDRFCRHTGAVIFDYIGINRWNRDYKQCAIYAAAKSMAEGRKAGETVV
ncbi:MAG: flavodoxin family protein [Treponema sp.]|nr:flavodoxin family protein [Treponema sp.]